jgi:3-phenylpropionate/trans-cinnamate dioxygenase ferredoxin reductase subunit
MRRRRRHALLAAFWLAAYVLLVSLPLLVLKIGPTPPGRGFWREFSVGLAFSGLAMMSLQFLLTARFRRLKAPYGSDVVYLFHEKVSYVAIGLVLSHPLILFVNNPDTLNLLNLVQAPWRARWGVTALLILVGAIALSRWRKRFRLSYERWRIWHGVLTTAAVALAMAHVAGVGYYVSSPWKQALWTAYGVSIVGLIAYVRVGKPILQLRHPYKVVEVHPERGSSWTLVLEPDRHRGLRFEPGQFAWITVWDSPFRDHEHPFSFSSSAEEKSHFSFTIKALGDFTSRIKDLVPGETVYVDGPHGAFSIDRHPHAPGHVFIAGGIGITPIMSMLRTLADRRDQRPLTLLYANKAWDGITFRDEVEGMQEQLNLRVIHVLESPPEDWAGERGYLTQALLEASLPQETRKAEHFICGPAPMMDAVERNLVRMGVARGDIHTERFNLV